MDADDDNARMSFVRSAKCSEPIYRAAAILSTRTAPHDDDFMKRPAQCAWLMHVVHADTRICETDVRGMRLWSGLDNESFVLIFQFRLRDTNLVKNFGLFESI